MNQRGPNNIKHIPQQYNLKRWTIDAKVLDITSNCNLHEDCKAILTKPYKELCRMFIQIAARAAESEESYLMAANYAEKLAEDVEKCLKHRSDPDTGNSVCSQGMYIQFYALIKLKFYFYSCRLKQYHDYKFRTK